MAAIGQRDTVGAVFCRVRFIDADGEPQGEQRARCPRVMSSTCSCVPIATTYRLACFVGPCCRSWGCLTRPWPLVTGTSGFRCATCAVRPSTTCLPTTAFIQQGFRWRSAAATSSGSGTTIGVLRKPLRRVRILIACNADKRCSSSEIHFRTAVRGCTRRTEAGSFRVASPMQCDAPGRRSRTAST